MPEGPNKVVQSSREVIERKLLAALGDPETVAILASREDLDLFIFCLSKIAASEYETEMDHFRSSEEVVRELRARELCAGLEQLRREAFGE